MSDLDDLDVEFAINAEPRAACLLLLDTSWSMRGKAIDELNEGLKEFKADIMSDPLARERVEVAIVTFGERAELVRDFETADSFDPPMLEASGRTPLGAALELGLETLRQRKERYRANSVNYFRPWLFIVTDGEPTDAWEEAAAEAVAAEKKGSVILFVVAVEGAKLSVLNRICGINSPLQLKGLKFREFFRWLSQSTRQGSQGTPGDQVELPSFTGWGAIPS